MDFHRAEIGCKRQIIPVLLFSNFWDQGEYSGAKLPPFRAKVATHSGGWLPPFRAKVATFRVGSGMKERRATAFWAMVARHSGPKLPPCER